MPPSEKPEGARSFAKIFGKDYFEASAFERLTRWMNFVPADSKVSRFLWDKFASVDQASNFMHHCSKAN